MKRLSLIAICLLPAACVNVPGQQPGTTAAASQEQAPPAPQVAADSAPRSSDLLGLMESLVVASDEQWTALHEQVAASVAASEDAGGRLRMAIVLSTPGRAGSDDARAAELLQELVSQPDTLSEAEIRIARLRLAEIRARTELRERVRELEGSVAELEEKIRALTRIEETVAPTAAPANQ